MAASRETVLTAMEGGQPPSEINETGGKAMATRPEALEQGAAAQSNGSRRGTKKKMSPQQVQYYKAIAMSDADLGTAIKAPTESIARHVGNALAHDAEAKNERLEAQREFKENIGNFYEAKQRLLNPGYRTDVDWGRERTPAENEKNHGAPNWAAFAEKCVAYSLQHADRMLKAFAKANGLLTDEGTNIDDPEGEEEGKAGLPKAWRSEDPTAQRRYEFVAAAAMDIANRNPKGEVEKQILAAAEHQPAPVMPVPPDLFTQVLNFLTGIPAMVAHAGIIAEAKELAAKMRLHQPTPEAAAVPAEIAKEEKRKRDKRLAKKNDGPLGSAASAPGTSGTSEHVQGSAPAEGAGAAAPASDVEARRLGKARDQRAFHLPQNETQPAAMAASPAAAQDPGSLEGADHDAPQTAPEPATEQGSCGDARKRAPSRKATVCPPDLAPEEVRYKASSGAAQPGRRLGNAVCDENGKWVYEPEPESGEHEKAPDTQGLAAAATPYQVRKRVSGDYIDFAIFRLGDKTPYDVFEKEREGEARCACERLNASAIASPAAGSLAPPQADAQPARPREGTNGRGHDGPQGDGGQKGGEAGQEPPAANHSPGGQPSIACDIADFLEAKAGDHFIPSREIAAHVNALHGFAPDSVRRVLQDEYLQLGLERDKGPRGGYAYRSARSGMGNQAKFDKPDEAGVASERRVSATGRAS